MRCPTTNSLISKLNLTRDQARAVRRLARKVDSGEDLQAEIEARHPDTLAYVQRMHGSPWNSRMWRVTVALHAIDRAIGTYGIEALRAVDDPELGPPSFEYCNAGDTYAATLIYSHRSDTLRIGSWGDIVEAYPERFQ